MSSLLRTRYSCRRTRAMCEKKGQLTAPTGIVTAAAPACAHAAACITPDTEVKLTVIPCSHCRLAAATMPASVAGIYRIGHFLISTVDSRSRGEKFWLTATMIVRRSLPSFSKRATRLRAFASNTQGSSSSLCFLRGSSIVQCVPSTNSRSAFPSSANYGR
jgi:hypothetical protein